MKSKIKDKKALNLIEKIIDSTNDDKLNEEIERICNNEINKVKKLNISKKEKETKINSLYKIKSLKFNNKGIPIGNMTSQGFSIIYLNEFDHFVKEKMHQKYYIRYMDDFICLSNDKEELKKLKFVFKDKIYKDYKLNLNKKTQIGCLDDGLYFLGFIFKLKNNKLYLKLSCRIKKNFKKKVKKYKYDINNKEKFISIIGSYKGHLKNGNTYYLYNSVLNDINLKNM